MEFADKWARRVLYSHVRKEESGLSLTDYLCGRFSRFEAAGWRERIEAGTVTVNGRSVPPDVFLRRHDRVEFYPGDQSEPPADLRWRTVFEDSDLLVLEKSGDLCVHPTGPFFQNTLWHLAGGVYGELRFVNRLDRETSGLLIAARDARTAAAMDNRRIPIRKEYQALVFGDFPEYVHARGYLERDPASAVSKKKRFVPADRVPPGTESADTELRREATSVAGVSLVRAIPHTGRQHQIRATLYSLGFPLIGDKLYGPDERIFLKIRSGTISAVDLARLRLPRQALHAAVLAFPHPFTGAEIRCESPLPDEFGRFLCE